MAASGSQSVAVTSWNTLKFSWWENSQSIENNTTTVGWKMELIAGSSGYIASTASKSWWVNVNGSYYEGTNTIGINNNSTKVLASGTTTIPHNSDGSKTFSYSFAQTFGITFSGANIASKSGSGTGTLNKIPRASVLGDIRDFTISSVLYVPITKYSSSFTHNYSVWVGGKQIRFGAGITDSFTTTFTASELEEIYSLLPNTTVGVFTVYLDTYSGNTLIGSSPCKTAKGTMPTDVIPTVSIATSDPTGYKSKYGAFVQGQSKFHTEVTASGVYGSTIKSYKIEADGKTYTTNSATTDVISGSGTLTIKATVTDSRNRASAISGDVTVLPYKAPKINSLSVYRCNKDGEKTNSGGYLAVKFSADITALNNKNSAMYAVRYKKSADTNYTTETITDYSGQYTIQNGVFVFAADTSSSYDIILTASDDFSGVERTATGSSIKKLWSILKNGFGFAFGKIAEFENTIEFALDALFHNKANFLAGIQLNGTDLDYIVEQGESDGWFFRKWNSGVAECWKIHYANDVNAAATNYNGFYYSPTLSAPFPFVFANLPTVTVDGGSVSHMNFVRVFGSYSDAATFVVVGLANVTSTDVTVHIKAIGRWK